MSEDTTQADDAIDVALLVDPDAVARRLRRRTQQPDSVPLQPSPWPRRLAVLGVVALAVGAWAFAALATVRSLEVDLSRARGAVTEARELMAEGELQRAAELLGEATELLDAVPDRTSSVVLAPARIVPFASRNLEAVSVLGESGADVTAAGHAVLTTLLDRPGGLASLSPQGGRIPVDVLGDLSDDVARLAAAVDRSFQRVSAVPTSGLNAEVDDARSELLGLLESIRADVHTVAALTAQLPPFLGADGPRRYWVVAANPAETRGVAGFFGAYMVVEFDDGQLRLGEVGALDDLADVPLGELEPPDPSLAVRYDRFGGAGVWRNVNMTPDFPSAAQQIEQLWAATTSEELDGVIAVDPFAFEALLEVAGPVTVPGVGEIGPDEVVDFVTNSAYSAIADAARRKRIIGEVAAAAMLGFVADTDPEEVGALLRQLGEMADRGSLLLHATDADVQAAFVQVGVAGQFGVEEGDLLALTQSNGTGSKVDYYLSRALDYEVRLDHDGTATSTLEVLLANDAPTFGQPAYVIGDPPGVGYSEWDVGTALQYVSAYCPPGCRILDAPDRGYDDVPSVYQVELGHPVASTWILVPPGQHRELLYSWVTPRAWFIERGRQLYRLTYDHHPLVRPTSVVVSVHLPEGMVPADVPDGATVDGSLVTWEETMERDAVWEITLRPGE